MSQKAKYDPLEAAKVTDERQETDAKVASKQDWTPPAQRKTPMPPPPPPRKEELEAAAAEAPPPAPRPKRTLFRVLAPRQVSLGAQGLHRFKVGDVLDPAGYGGEERVLGLGLELEKFEE